MGVNQKDVGVLSGGDLVGIRRQRIHVAYVEGDTSEVAIGVVCFVLCGLRAKVDLGRI